MNLNLAHMHILLNHIPVLVIPLLVFSLAWGIVRRSDELKLFSLVVLIAVALITIPVYTTGQSADHMVNRLPGVLDSVIDVHEEAARYALIATEVLGGIALLSLLLYSGKKRFQSWLTALVFLGLILVSVMMARVAYLGGQVHHQEARPGWKAPTPEKEGMVPRESAGLHFIP